MNRFLFAVTSGAIMLMLVISCGDSSTNTDPGTSGSITMYDLSVSISPEKGGTVSSENSYEEGENVELQAEANEGYTFTGWSGDVESSENPLSFTMDQDYNLTANFEAKTVVYQQGTIFLFPDMINDSDPTRYQSLSYTGRGEVEMFDRRVNNWVTVNAYLFKATFEGGETVQVEVNTEFSSQANATAVAEKYLPAIGQIPAVLHKDLNEIWIHKGNKAFGGGNNSLLIHDEYGDTYIQDDILAETFMHEAVHTSLDAGHATSTGWKDAQRKDPSFISQYAKDYPEREDLAESFAAYIAIELRSNRISQEDVDTVRNRIPHRINYFKNQSFDMYPLTEK